jgi:hypothetical protein
VEALRKAAQFESSMAIQLSKLNEISHLRGRSVTALLCLISPDICDAQPALDDVRNWMTDLPALKPEDSSSVESE